MRAALVPALALLLALAGCTTSAPDAASTSSPAASATPPPSATPSPTSPTPTPTPTAEVPQPTPSRPGTATAANGCLKAPTWEGGRTLFGTSVSTRTLSFAEAVRRKDARYGRLDVVRMFDSTAPPRTLWQNRGPSVAARVVVGSFRMPPREVLAGVWDQEVLHYFQTLPGDVTLFWSYFHEMERHIDAGEFTAAEFRAAFRHVVDLAASVCRSQAYPTLVLTGYTALAASGRDWRTYYPGRNYVSVMAWDPYNHASSQPDVYEPPAVLYDPVVAVSAEAGKPFAIAETGSQLIPGDRNGRQRAAWLAEVAAYAVRHDAVFVTYYDSIGYNGPDYRLRDRASADAWSSVLRGR